MRVALAACLLVVSTLVLPELAHAEDAAGGSGSGSGASDPSATHASDVAQCSALWTAPTHGELSTVHASCAYSTRPAGPNSCA